MASLPYVSTASFLSTNRDAFLNNDELKSELNDEIGELKELSLDEVSTQIARRLDRAKNPLISGLGNLSTEAQRHVMRLARDTRATVDSSAINQGRGNLFAFQKRGRVTATAGEIRSRSNLVLFWFCDPGQVIKAFGKGILLPEKIRACKTIYVGERSALLAESIADEVLELDPEKSVAAIWYLRARIKGLELEKIEGLPHKKLGNLALGLRQSTYGAMIWGNENSAPEFDVQADGIHSLVRELNQHTRFVGLPFRDDFNTLGAENVSTWTSGFPFAVNFNRSQPRQYWLEYSDELVSERQEWDLLISFEKEEIVIVALPTETESALQIVLPMAELGVSDRGDICRMDDVCITLEASNGSSLQKFADDDSGSIDDNSSSPLSTDLLTATSFVSAIQSKLIRSS